MYHESRGPKHRRPLVAFSTIVLAASAAWAGARIADATALRAALSLDLNGDGVGDPVERVVEGENRTEARDGKGGRTLWTSPCFMREWGETNRLGRFQAPFLYDANGDDLPDLIFPANGCGPKKIVALDRRTGRILWQVAAEQLGMNTWPDVPWTGDVLFAGERILVASQSAPEDAERVDSKAGSLVALSARDGSILWHSLAPFTKVGAWKYPEVYFEGNRIQSAESTSLSLGSVGSVSTPASLAYSETTGWTKNSGETFRLKPLMRLADSLGVLVTDSEIVVAGGPGVSAIQLEDGTRVWSWNPPVGDAKDVVFPMLLRRNGAIYYFGWIDHGSRHKPRWAAVLASLNGNSGTQRWIRRLDLTPVSSGGFGYCSLSMTLSNRLRIEYASPNEKVILSRILEIDMDSGEPAD